MGTIYETVPAGAKTADITFKYLGVNYLTLTPYAITQISQTVSGNTTVLNSPVGPAGVPTLTGSNDALVKYCVYVTNVPTSGTLNFQLTNPVTGVIIGACFYDASCNANCISTGGVLAIEMNSFKARKTSAGILLEWSTTNEFNTQSFEIEKSSDGQRFNKIDDKAAMGSGSANYSYTDYTANSGTNFYRLKIVNNDGSYQYSNIVQIKDINVSFVINKVQPNPFVNEIIIDAYLQKSGTVYIQLLDINGKAVAKKQAIAASGTNLLVMDNLNVGKGIYFLKLTCGNNSWKQKLIN